MLNKKELFYSEIKKYQIYEDKNFVRNAVDKIKNLVWVKIRKKLRQSFSTLLSWARKNNKEQEILSVFNKYTGKNKSKLSDYSKLKISESLNEGDWAKEAGSNLYNALAFYPLLTAFIELDKLVKGVGGADLKYVITYALIWVAIITGKVLKDQIIKKKETSIIKGVS